VGCSAVFGETQNGLSNVTNRVAHLFAALLTQANAMISIDKLAAQLHEQIRSAFIACVASTRCANVSDVYSSSINHKDPFNTMEGGIKHCLQTSGVFKPGTHFLSRKQASKHSVRCTACCFYSCFD
jgi:hypothetical protein